MEIVNIEGKLRTEIDKKVIKALRAIDQVPCVIYGGAENIHFSAHKNSFTELIYTPEFKLASLNVDGKSVKAFIKEVQFHPVTDNITHVDFMELVPGKTFKVEIPISLKGLAVGVKNGGKLQQKVRKVKVKTTPESLVNALIIDVSELEMGKSLRVRDIQLADGIEIMSNGATPVASVEIPRALKSAQMQEEEAAKGAVTATPEAEV